jgi:uncharacterized membrane protein YqiK
VVPFLLPVAVALMSVLAICLVVFLRYYQVATPGTALVRKDQSHQQRVVLLGGAFGPSSAFDRLLMTERQIEIEGQAVLSLRPAQSESAVLQIASSLGCTRANDDVVLMQVLQAALKRDLPIVDGTTFESRARAVVESELPGFALTSAVVTRS